MSKLNKMREQIANEFIAALQKDEIPWHQDWHNIGGAPHNAVTGRAYHASLCRRTFLIRAGVPSIRQKRRVGRSTRVKKERELSFGRCLTKKKSGS